MTKPKLGLPMGGRESSLTLGCLGGGMRVKVRRPAGTCIISNCNQTLACLATFQGRFATLFQTVRRLG